MNNSINRLVEAPAQELIDIQISREKQMTIEGHDRYLGRQSSLSQNNLSLQNEPHKLIEKAVEKVAAILDRDLNFVGTGAPAEWKSHVKTIETHVLAFAGLSIMMSAFSGSRTMTSAVTDIGKRIELEVWGQGFRAHDKDMYKRVSTQVTKAHSSERYRLKSIRHIAKQEGYCPEAWKGPKRTKVGAAILNAVLEGCGIFNIHHEYVGLNKTLRTVVLTDEATRLLEDREFHASWADPMYAPMVTPPLPWTSFEDGGFLSTKLNDTVDLVRHASGAQRRAIVEAFEEKETPVFVQALNAVQATPLLINNAIVAAVAWCWDEGKSFGKFPMAKPPAFPRFPANFDTLNDDDQAQWRKNQKNWHLKKRECVAANHVMQQDLKQARDLETYDQFWLVWNLDFRARMYPVSSFNYHRADHVKAMFQLGRGKLITAKDADWLKVHIANCGDFDKISKQSFDARLEWVSENHDQIIAVAEDYKKTYDYWSTADKPFQFLAACLAYRDWLDEGAAYVCHLPPSLDGTNSGAQHYSAAMRDKETGYLTNLVPSERCQDVYAVVAKAVTERLKVEAAEGVELAKIWLDFGVTRTVVKRNTMTYTYSGTQHGFGDQLKEDLMAPLINDVLYGRLKSHPFGSQREQNLAARYLAGINYDCIGDVLVAASRGMEYFRKVTGVVALENKALRWTNPVGFPVCQRYNKSKMLKVRMFLYDREAQVHKRSQVTIKVDEEHTVDRKKAMNGCAPNVIHSLDSAHMMSSVAMMLDNGVEDFFLIHDSFGTQCADTDVMYQCVRAAFVDLYQDGTCIFEDFDDQIRDQLRDPSNAKLPDIPRKGDLDINLVKESEYCFS